MVGGGGGGGGTGKGKSSTRGASAPSWSSTPFVKGFSSARTEPDVAAC